MLAIDVLLPCGTDSARRRHIAHGARCRTCWPDTGLPPLPEQCHSDSDIETLPVDWLDQMIRAQFGPGEVPW